MSNIISFDQARANQSLKNIEANAVEDSYQDGEEEQASIAGFMAQEIVDVLSEMGYDPYENSESIREICGIIENIKGYMCRCKNTPHIIHEINNKLFKVDDAVEALDNFLEAEME